VVLLAAWHGFVGNLFVTSHELAASREERDLLAAEVERLRTQLAVESATRSELEKQVAELNAQVVDLNRQVEFLTARRRPGSSTH